MAQYESLEAKPGQRKHWSWSGWWWQEILSSTTSLGCMVAVIIILKTMENQNMDRWTFFLSLNATIALVITAAKSTALLSVAACISQWKWVYFSARPRRLEHVDLIEEASRGPYGSLGMIVRIPWSMATLGAIVTVVALGIDTFAQQVISQDSTITWVDDGGASFGLAQDYHTNATFGISNLGSEFTYSPFTVDTAMQGAVYKAFYGLETPAVFNCTSNCTWNDSHISLGFSTACTNVTQAAYATKNCTTSKLNGGENCTMTTPGDVTFTIAEVPTDWDTALVIKAKSLYPLGLSGDATYPATFMRIVAFRQSSSYSGDAAIEQTLECDLSFAAYKYTNASSVASNFSIQNTEIIPLDPGHLALTWTNETSYLSDSIVFNTSGLPEFRLAETDIGALLDFFPSDSFSGTLVDGESAPVYAAGITAALRNPQKNMTALFASMATMMTDQLRSSYDASARGLSARSVVLVRVRWAWLALPLFVVLAAAVLLVAEIAESRAARGVPLWKSSSTALLFHSVSPEANALRPQVRSPEQLRRAVESARVALDNQQIHHHLSSVPASGSVGSRTPLSYSSPRN